VNTLLNQTDIESHNYYLYNPIGSTKFYFIPWDYDGALDAYTELPNSTASDDLATRFRWGYDAYKDNDMFVQAIKLPGIHQEVLALINDLRQTVWTDEIYNALIDANIPIVLPMISSLPDLPHVPKVRDEEGLPQWHSHVAQLRQLLFLNEKTIKEELLPLSPYAKKPFKSDDQWVLWWNPSVEILGQAVNYRVEISRTVEFDDIVYSQDGIANVDSGTRVEHIMQGPSISSGTYYFRVFAYFVDKPQLWQVSANNDVAGALGSREIKFP